ncbi:hypothetical protein TVAG_278040 [Trichomonas vaginalis G3]|uniref:RRM domain-containing protein n=1 Tax=Trichomonas vaginalis (strain ATCC PRA-98 / G3) TaxID=412133 RepID=A2DU45_TRIV3|nr:RNA binding [Trichomonas vaginalis G3]EAY16038.1 hypothetical protein TVAG_278040 [Trichomonas vaginalis G3]KAI5537301.1 RNA binding [Trichomonas vaginalis G3]|eukprot:XP_001328261.1 hypothetical protein [Trichomonas vaginalis G3]
MEQLAFPTSRAHRRAHAFQRVGSLKNIHHPRSKSLLETATIIVTGFTSDVTQETIQKAFSVFGNIVSCTINTNETEPINPTANIVFSNPDEAKAAVSNISSIKVCDKPLLACFGISKEKEKRASRVISVRKIPKDVDLDTIKQIFSRFGEIESTKSLVTDDQDVWKAIIIYQTFEAASAAIQSMNGMIISSSKPISVKFYDAGGMLLPSPVMCRRNSSRLTSSDLFDLSSMVH